MQEKLQAKYREDESTLASENEGIKMKIREMEALMESMTSRTSEEKAALEESFSQLEATHNSAIANHKKRLEETMREHTEALEAAKREANPLGVQWDVQCPTS